MSAKLGSGLAFVVVPLTRSCCHHSSGSHCCRLVLAWCWPGAGLVLLVAYTAAPFVGGVTGSGARLCSSLLVSALLCYLY